MSKANFVTYTCFNKVLLLSALTCLRHNLVLNTLNCLARSATGAFKYIINGENYCYLNSAAATACRYRFKTAVLLIYHKTTYFNF